MELRPKAREKDVEAYIESCRTKFGCFESGGPGDDLAGEKFRYIPPDRHVPPLPSVVKCSTCYNIIQALYSVNTVASTCSLHVHVKSGCEDIGSMYVHNVV